MENKKTASDRKANSRRTQRATVPGAVSVEFEEPPTPPSSTRSSMSAQDAAEKSKSRRTQPGRAVSSSIQSQRSVSSKDSKISTGTGASKPGAVSIKGPSMMMDEEESDDDSGESMTVQDLDPEQVRILTQEMGFGLLLAQKSLLYSEGYTIDDALDWIQQHEDDADINEPIPEKREPDELAGSAVMPGAFQVSGDSPASSILSRKKSDAAFSKRSMRTTSSGMQSFGSSSLPGVQEVHGDDASREQTKMEGERPQMLLDGEDEDEQQQPTTPGAQRISGSGRNTKGPALMDDPDEEGPQLHDPAHVKSSKNKVSLIYGDDEPDAEEGILDKKEEDGGPRGIVASMGVAVGRTAGRVASMGVAVRGGRNQREEGEDLMSGRDMLNAPVQHYEDWNSNDDLQRSRKELEDSQRKCRICACIIVVVILAVVGVVVGVTVGGGGGGGNNPTQNPSPAPTLTPTRALVVDLSECFEETGGLDFSDRYVSIRAILLDQSGGETAQLDVPETPQRQALCWLADGDGLELGADAGNAPALIQRYSIATFYYSLANPPSLLLQSNWLSPQSECLWDGLSCEETDVLTGISLIEQSLNGTLPEEIVDLVNLEIFDVSKNDFITGQLPSGLWQLINLRELVFDFTGLSGSIPGEIGNLINLEVLFGPKEFTGTIPDEMGSLTNLVSMLWQADFTGTIPTIFGNFQSLESLSLSTNGFVGPIPSELGKLESLKFLDLSSNEFQGFSLPTELGLMRSVEILSFNFCRLNGQIPSEFGLLESMVELTLAINELTGTVPTTLGNLNNMTVFQMQSNKVGGIMPSEVCALRDINGGKLGVLTADCGGGIECSCCTSCGN